MRGQPVSEQDRMINRIRDAFKGTLTVEIFKKKMESDRFQGTIYYDEYFCVSVLDDFDNEKFIMRSYKTANGAWNYCVRIGLAIDPKSIEWIKSNYGVR
jgi:hypothetical protein